MNLSDPIGDFDAYLAEVVKWLSGRRTQSISKPAQEVIRESGTQFPGIGAYTVNELFARAGVFVRQGLSLQDADTLPRKVFP